MKTLKYLSIMLVMLACSVGFASCSDDDDDDVITGSNALIGTWVYTSNDGNTTKTYVFGSNNKGSFSNVSPGSNYKETFSYSFNEEEKRIDIVMDEDDTRYYFSNVRIVGNKITLDGLTYTRQ